ncbi:type II toxin-antitoxin system RelB family antitoxin [Carnimonas bestiolae]|uniref:type II toxin-antitoxin system RelB family antitoxin n=1 Tax=Carnimonas bestiolae TaxID=3402172 RepID=UPI003EDC93F9
MRTPFDPRISEFATQEDADSYDKWFREKIERSLADTRPGVPHDQLMAELDEIIAKTESRRKRQA